MLAYIGDYITQLCGDYKEVFFCGSFVFEGVLVT